MGQGLLGGPSGVCCQGICYESDSNHIWRADLDSSPNEILCHDSINFLGTVLEFDACPSQKRLQNLLGISQESIEYL